MPPKKAAPKKAAPKKAAPKKAAPKKAAPKKAAPKKAAAPNATPKAAPPAASPKLAAKAPAKRARPSAAAESPRPVKAPKTASAASAGVCRPPMDEHCTVALGQVYMDPHGVAWGVKLNQTNIGHNNNKFYIIQLVEYSGGCGYACFTRWGRVGEAGQNSTEHGLLEAMQSAFAKKFKDKTRNDWGTVQRNASAFKPSPGKYDLVDTDTSATPAQIVQTEAGDVVKVLPSKLHASLETTLKLIFDRDMFNKQMKEKNIDANRMPLGKLTKAQVQRGYEALEAIETITKKAKKSPKDGESLKELSSKFYTIIPHDFGRAVPPVIDTAEMVSSKYDLLNMLNDIQIAVAMEEAVAASSAKAQANPIDLKYKELGCSLNPVDKNSEEFKLISTYTTQTQSTYRPCHIQHVFRVDRPEDKARMASKHGKEGGRYLLWHGTNVAVVAAILKTGLRIMPHAGGRVGRGLYFASENGKSSGYVGCHGKTGIMFLVEVCMGDKMNRILRDDSSLCHDKVKGLGVSSVLACGRQDPDPSVERLWPGEWGKIVVPQGKPVPQPQYQSSSFSQSEWLVYEESRARIKYMLEVTF